MTLKLKIVKKYKIKFIILIQKYLNVFVTIQTSHRNLRKILHRKSQLYSLTCSKFVIYKGIEVL